MACKSCSSGGGSPKGCQNNGHCSTGGCNKLNTFDWLSKMDIPDYEELDIIEVSFKNGARKGFYRKPSQMPMHNSQTVVVEAGTGYDMGRVSLMGELVRLQMKKKRVTEEAVAFNVVRIANERDIERLEEARAKEQSVMVRSRAIARSLNLDMKIGDVEYQGDKRKATFYYTAEGRVDFRELIRHYAREFRIKIEMRQIGARQESARIGGLGSCGRELCCSTWLTDFKSVSTTAARYQNLAINQSKLSGQCGRLKCCLNYELDTYLDALKAFPKKADKLYTEAGMAVLLKTDIFKGIMYYAYKDNIGKYYPVPVERVKEILKLNATGGKAVELIDSKLLAADYIAEIGFEDGSGEIELPPEKRRRKKKRKKASNSGSPASKGGADRRKTGTGNKPKSTTSNKPQKSTNQQKSTPKNSSGRGAKGNASSSNNKSRKGANIEKSAAPNTKQRPTEKGKTADSSSRKPRPTGKDKNPNQRNTRHKDKNPKATSKPQQNTSQKKTQGKEGTTETKSRRSRGRNRRSRGPKPSGDQKKGKE